MTYHSHPPCSLLAIVGQLGPLMHRVASTSQVLVCDDTTTMFAVVADDPAHAELMAARVVDLLNEHGLVDVPDTAEQVDR